MVEKWTKRPPLEAILDDPGLILNRIVHTQEATKEELGGRELGGEYFYVSPIAFTEEIRPRRMEFKGEKLFVFFGDDEVGVPCYLYFISEEKEEKLRMKLKLFYRLYSLGMLGIQ